MTKPLALLLLGIACSTLPAADSPWATTAPTTAPASQPATQSAKNLTLDLGDDVQLPLVLIPPGKFLMGSPPTEKERDKNETQHEVTLTKPFYMGITHVTVGQFAAFSKDSGYKTDAEKVGVSSAGRIKDGKLEFKDEAGCSWLNPGFAQAVEHPVVQIDWSDAQAFCAWLSKKSGRTVTLPTEAQWEYACRAGTKTAFPWGESPDDGKGWDNCADQSLRKKLPNHPPEQTFFSWDDGFVFTSPVGSFKANAFGLYDMNGNAWQWCQDRANDRSADYDKAAATDPTGTAIGGLRVLRGGSWYFRAKYCRSARRTMYYLEARSSITGFRVVVTD